MKLFLFKLRGFPRMCRMATFTAGITLCGCATPHMTEASYPRVYALPVQKGDTGNYYNDQDENILISEGIPESWFASTPRGHYLTQGQVVAAGDIRAGKRNPQIWVP